MRLFGLDIRRTGLYLAVLLFFLVSGACGLLYQVVWTRKLVLLFGTTSYAVSTVLSIFFLGLAGGSLWGGRLADRTRHPLFLYGVFEVVIGLWALFFILAITGGESALVALLRAAAASRAVAIGLRAVLALVLLAVPVTLMGATLPLLAKHVGADERMRGFRIGLLYSLNTFGAVAGCALTGFVLLAAYGYTRTTLIGAGANVVVGLLAMGLASTTHKKTPATADVVARPPDEASRPWAATLVVACFALSGMCALALEVLWTRMLVVVFLGTTYAFTTMLTTVLCGIAAGSAFASFIADRRRHPMALFGVTEVLIGLACLLSLQVFAALPEGLAGLRHEMGYQWTQVVRAKFLLSFATLFAPTFLFGMTFPFVVKAVTAAGSSLGRDIGRLYSANTFGGVIGAVLGGYLLIPLLGTQTGVTVLACGLIVAGLVLVLACPGWRWAGWGTLLAVAVLAVGVVLWLAGFRFDETLRATSDAITSAMPLLGRPMGLAILALLAFVVLVSLVFLPPAVHLSGKLGTAAVLALAVIAAALAAPSDISRALNETYLPEEHETIYYDEGVEGTVAVAQPVGNTSGAERVLYINGVQATASIEKGVKMNRLQGVLPLLFDRDPETVLFMCFGSGITAGTLALSGFERIDAVEISAEVLDAAPLFEGDNLGVLERPQVNFIIDDGRNFLLTTDRRYDVITFEPMPLALAGVSTFYTREYYELCLARLQPGGIVSQWVPLHSLNLEVVKSLIATFTEVFPEYCAWFVNADLFLAGSDRPLRIDYANAQRVLADPVVGEALRDVGFKDVPELLTAFFMPGDQLDRLVSGSRVMTDDRPWAEFVAPCLVFESQDNVAEALEVLIPLYECPADYTDFGGMPAEQVREAREALERRCKARRLDLEGVRLYYSGMVGGKQDDYFKKALSIDPGDWTARYYLKEVLEQTTRVKLGWQEYDEAEAAIEDALRYMPDSAELWRLLAQVHEEAHDPVSAAECRRRAEEIEAGTSSAGN